MTTRYTSPTALDNFVPIPQHASMVGEVRVRVPVHPYTVRVSSIARDLGIDTESVLVLIDKIDDGVIYHEHDGDDHHVAVMPGHWAKWSALAGKYFRRAYAAALARNVPAPDDWQIELIRNEYQQRHNATLTPRQADAYGRMTMEGFNED